MITRRALFGLTAGAAAQAVAPVKAEQKVRFKPGSVICGPVGAGMSAASNIKLRKTDLHWEYDFVRDA